MKRFVVVLVGAAIAIGVAGCEEDGICDGDELSSTLFRAFEGDTVRVGACQVQGTFIVPPGVTLSGSGISSTFLMSDGNEPVVRVEPGSVPTTIRSLAVRSTGRAAVLVVGEGEAILENIDVQANHGIGIGVEEVTELTMSNISLMGPVTVDNVDTIPPEVTYADIATHGLVLVHVGEADLSDVMATGFATMGVLAVDASTTWQAGGSSGNRGTGVMVHGGTAFLRNLELCGALGGLSLIPPYSTVFADGAYVESEGLNVCNSGGLGMFQDNSVSLHTSLQAVGNSGGGVWAQNDSQIEISGTDNQIVENGFVGVMLIDSDESTITGADISRTRTVKGVHFETRTIDVGDGMQLLRPVGEIFVSDTTFDNNERIGILLQAEGVTNVTLTDVEINGEDDGFGAVAQGDLAQIPEDWDRDVERNDVAAANDAARVEPLRFANPAPADEFPAAETIAEGGLAEILGGTL